MKLYMSSYKLGNRTIFLKEWIQNNENKIVLISNARDHKEESIIQEVITTEIKSLEDLGFQVKNISLKEYFGNYEKLKKDLQGYYAFYVIGGNVFVLRQAMKLSGFDIYLKEIANNEKYLYAGYSAGICVLAPSLEGLDIVDETINPYNKDKINYDGIGLLDYVPIPHYKSNHKESKLIDDVVKYFEKRNIKFKTLKDGDVIIDEIK